MSDQLVIRCGDNLSDHGDLAAGELMLIRGSDMLLTLARVTGHDGTERQAEYCNAPVLLEGPAGTVRQQSNDRKASFPTWEDTAGYSYAEMEYANAYAYPVAGNLFSPLTEARRTVLWVKDKGLLLVWDRIAKAKADTRIRLNWNVQTSPTFSGAAVSPAGVLHVKGVVPGWRIVRKSDR